MLLARFSTFSLATFLIIDCFSWQSRACEHADRYLCRMCGLSLGDAGSVFDIVSPFTQSHRNETFLDQSLSGHEQFGSSTLVQRLQNPAGVIFDVVTIRESSCKGIGKWSSEASWFPGYSWKACVCRHCGRHLGWMFELDSLAQGTEPLQPSEAGFYAIIRENLLTETVAQSLTFVPKIFRQ